MVETSRIFWWSIFPVSIGIVGSLYLYSPHFPNIASLGANTYCYSHVYTLDEKYSAKCFQVGQRHGKIISVTNDTLSQNIDSKGETIAIPGLWDGHGHVIQLGEMLEGVNMKGSASVEEVHDRVIAHLNQNPNLGTCTSWIRGFGWDQSLLFPPTSSEPSRFPTSADLQHPLLKDKFILLDRIDGHCVWVSEAVLSLLPPEYGEPNPNNTYPGGEIPSRGIFCDNAIDVVMDVYPKPGKEEKTRWLEMAMAELNKVGFTGVTDAGVVEDDLEIYRWMGHMKLLSLRINALVECKKRNTFCPEEVDRFRGRSVDSMFSVLGVKLFADGALGSWGAALIEPYADKPNHSGTMLINATQLESVVSDWHRAGWQVAIHAIGDMANRAAILALGKMLRHECVSLKQRCNLRWDTGRRHRIEHAQIVHPRDQAILSKLGLIPSIQPTHATSDAAYALARLGAERLSSSAYRMKSFYDMELPVVLGSDFPVEPVSPWNGLYAATERRDPNVERGREFYPAEKLGMVQALRGLTVNPVYGAYMETLTGSISEGKYGDWVVVRYAESGGKKFGSRFLEEGWEGDVRKMEVVETWVGGRKVFDLEESDSKSRGSYSTKGMTGWLGIGEWRPWEGRGVMKWVQRVFGNTPRIV